MEQRGGVIARVCSSLLAVSPTPADLLLIPPAADGRNQADQLPVNVALHAARLFTVKEQLGC